MTVTFDLPEPLAKQLLSMPEHERNHFAVARLADDDAGTLELPEQDSLSDALAEGFADDEAGRTISLEDYRVQRQSFYAAKGVTLD